MEDRKIFSMVYDCGVDSDVSKELTREINKFETEIEDSRINLLIISHLHDDHINGLDILLSNIKYIDNIILPYLTDVEKICLLFENKYAYSSQKHNGLIEMIINPSKYFYDKKIEVGRIIFLEHGDSNIKEGDLLKQINLLDDDINEQLSKISNTNEIHDVRKNDINVFYCNDDIEFSVSFKWIYKFYIKSSSEILEAIDTFHLILQNNNIEEDKDLRKILQNKTQFKILKNAYKSINKDLNYTSLSVYHGPIDDIYQINLKYNDRNIFDWCTLHKLFMECCDKYYDKLKSATLLLGDSMLLYNESKKNTVENSPAYELIKHFSDNKDDNIPYLNNMLMCTAPHHGSDRSWDGKLLHYTDSDIWIITAGIKNKYKHPDAKVINDIILSNKICLRVDERMGLEYNIEIMRDSLNGKLCCDKSDGDDCEI